MGGHREPCGGPSPDAPDGGAEADVRADRAQYDFSTYFVSDFDLEGYNVLPQLGGFTTNNQLDVLPGAHLVLERENVSLVADPRLESGGRITTFYRHADRPGNRIVEGHRAVFVLSAEHTVDSLRVTSFGNQSPPSFANAAPRWWRGEASPEYAGERFEEIQVHLDAAAVPVEELEALGLYHSADGGQTWELLEVDFRSMYTYEAA